MSGTTKSPAKLTRRSFLMTTGAALGALALTGCAAEEGDLAPVDPAETAERTTCVVSCTGNCNGFCSMEAEVEDGKVVNISRLQYPNTRDYSQTCQRGYAMLERIYDPKRLLYPMRRVGERGAAEFERITWDEAYQEIAEKLNGYIAEFGPHSISVLYGSGSTRADGGRQWTNRFAKAVGTTVWRFGYDQNGMCGMPTSFGYTNYGGFGNNNDTLEQANKLFFWGANPTESHIIYWHRYATARERGAKVFSIDPNYTIAASKSDEWVAIRPGTDALLAMGMMQEIVEQGLTDEAKLKSMTVAPFLVKDSDYRYLRASDLGLVDLEQEDAKDYLLVTDGNGNFDSAEEIADPAVTGTFDVNGEKVTTAYDILLERIYEHDMAFISETTEIPEAKIRELAREFCDGPTTVVYGYGPDHYNNGHTFYHAVGALLILSNQYAVSGAGYLGPGVTFLSVPGPNLPVGLTEPKPTQSLQYTKLHEILATGKQGNFEPDAPIKALIVSGANTIAVEPARRTWIDTLGKLDFIVVADMYMTETCKYADILLPVAHWWETESFYNYGVPYLRVTEAAIPPMGESKGDYEIVRELEKAMGLDIPESDYLDRETALKMAFENDMCSAAGYTWEKLKEEKVLEAPTDMTDYLGMSGGFSTATGRAQFFYEGIAPKTSLGDLGEEFDTRRESSVYWIPPSEAWEGTEEQKKYPIQFQSERGKFFAHTQFGYCPTLREIDPEPTIRVNPETAEARGVADGDHVYIHNDRGDCVARAWHDAGVRPGVVIMDHGWQDEHFIEGHYGDFPTIETNNLYLGCAWFEAQVEFEKYEER